MTESGRGAKRKKSLLRRLARMRLALPGPLVALLEWERFIRGRLFWLLRSKLYYENLLRRRAKVGRGLVLEGAMPLIMGGGTIDIGDNVSVGDRNAWLVGRRWSCGGSIRTDGKLSIGAGTTVNYATIISVADEVRIGNRCRIAEQVKIFDNNTHPVDWRVRAENDLLTDKDVAPVVIEDDAWVGMCSIILKGVTIGRGAVVAAGAVVTKDVPAGSVVAGNPARVVKQAVGTAPPETCRLMPVAR